MRNCTKSTARCWVPNAVGCSVATPLGCSVTNAVGCFAASPVGCCRARIRWSAPPHENVTAARSSSHGSRRTNAASVVRTSSRPPIRPPARLTPPSDTIHARVAATSRRYAQALDSDAGHSARVFVAFADTAGTPAKISAGRAMNDPPPATAFSAPPTNAATKRNKLTDGSLIVQFSRAQECRGHPPVDDPPRNRARTSGRRHHRRTRHAVRRHHEDDPPRSAGARGSRLPDLRRSLARRRTDAVGPERTGLQRACRRLDRGGALRAVLQPHARRVAGWHPVSGRSTKRLREARRRHSPRTCASSWISCRR